MKKFKVVIDNDVACVSEASKNLNVTSGSKSEKRYLIEAETSREAVEIAEQKFKQEPYARR